MIKKMKVPLYKSMTTMTMMTSIKVVLPKWSYLLQILTIWPKFVKKMAFFPYQKNRSS
jgi:hypothetical protein